ncbi:MAG TPA: glycerophosphodiester phosphodiesterase family protein [Gemmatimonadales bacterium]|jgi:glycerophosphoryl diester phosphodiesterase|nr:glycerophosphodiester phosphodiesterase family protein [Gemmatimonadales bacterium]
MNPLLDLFAHPVIGHRGASGVAPENTCESLELAIAQGAEAVELDVHLAADGTPVLMHDESLDRTTGSTGLLRSRSAKELAGLDAGYHFTLDAGLSFPWRNRGICIPTLAEVLERFPAMPLLIELKTVEVAEPVRELLVRFQAQNRVVLASFLDAALVPFRGQGFHLGASRRRIAELWVRSKLGFPAPSGPEEFYAVPDLFRDRLPVPTSRFIRAARRAGRPVHVWTVDDPVQAAQLWRLGVSGVITNVPALMLAERNRLFPAEQRSSVG